MFAIKRHAQDGAEFAIDGQTTHGNLSEVDALNGLLAIADTYTRNGWQASGAGYVLTLARPDTGTRVLYRVWRV